MPATIEQATTNGTKVMDRLMAQGRPHHEAARDAARWVWDNMGLVVTLDQKEGLEFCGACHTYRTAGSVCHTCHTCHTRMQDLFNRYERERRQTRNANGAEKRSRAARKAGATRKFNKVRKAWMAGQVSQETFKQARQDYFEAKRNIQNGL